MCFLVVAMCIKIPGGSASVFPDSILYFQRVAAVLGLLGFLQRPQVVGSAGLEYLV